MGLHNLMQVLPMILHVVKQLTKFIFVHFYFILSVTSILITQDWKGRHPKRSISFCVARRDFPTQINFPTIYWRTVLSIASTHEWLRGTWGFYVYFDQGFGHADASDVGVERIRELSVLNQQECIGRCACELQIPTQRLTRCHTHAWVANTRFILCVF